MPNSYFFTTQTQKPMISKSNNPLLPIALSLAAGSGCAAQGWLPANTALWLMAGLFFTGTLIAIAKKNLLASNICMILLFFLAGALYLGTDRQANLPPHHISNWINKSQPLCLTGILTQKPITKENRTKLIIASETILIPGKSVPQTTTGLVQLTVNTMYKPTRFIPGNRYCIRTSLKEPRNFKTPGTFDYQRYLADHNILATGWVQDTSLIQPIHTLSSPITWHGLLYKIESFRQELEAKLKATLNPREAGLYIALLIGDRSNVPQDILENFKAAGIMHLLAISGMHLGILALLIGGLFYWLFSRSTWLLLNIPVKKATLAATLAPLIFYVGMAGFQIPVVRSFIMVAVFMLAIFSNRQWSSLNNVAIAAILIIIWQPASVISVGFQLSFAATTAIVITSSRLQTWFTASAPHSIMQRARLYILSSLTISMVAFLAILPLSLFYFNRISPLSPITTLIISPLLCLWALPIGIIAVLSLNLAPQFSALLFTTGAKGLSVAEKLVDFCASLPLVSFRTITPTTTELMAAYAIMLLVLFWRSLAKWKYLALAGAIILIASPSIIYQVRNSKKTSISYLDVGQGSATVIKLADHKTILIDGGGPISNRFNIGENIIAPFLWKNRIRKIDQIIITHLHADHYNGLPFIITNFKPETLWLSGQSAPDPGFAEILTLADRMNCEIKIAQTNDQIYQANNINLRCIFNMYNEVNRPNNTVHFDENDTNNTGLVLQLTVGDHKFLFPGDIEVKGEALLCRSQHALASQVLLMPHHGRASSGSAQFIKAIKPEQIIVSAGKTRDNIGAAPVPIGTHIYPITTIGTVTLTTDGKKIL